jgi:hypothetical protein
LQNYHKKTLFSWTFSVCLLFGASSVWQKLELAAVRGWRFSRLRSSETKIDQHPACGYAFSGEIFTTFRQLDLTGLIKLDVYQV